MKKLFERILKPKQPTSEEVERRVEGTLAYELRNMSVDDPSARRACVRRAYEAAIKLNTLKKLGLTRNHILNLLRREAILAQFPAPAMDIELYKDTDGKIKGLIDQEIENVRREEQDKPQ